MDALVADLIKETTSTTGNGLTLTLTQDTNYGRFADAASVGEEVYYIIRSGSDSEMGIGTVQATNTFDRTTPLVTVVSGVYDDASPVKITLAGVSIVAIAPTAAALNDIISDAISNIVVFNAQTGTTYTAVLTDDAKMITMDNASANTFTVPPNSSVAFPIGTQLHVHQKGAGVTTIAEGAGVNINTPSTLVLNNQYSSASVIQETTDTWILLGDT